MNKTIRTLLMVLVACNCVAISRADEVTEWNQIMLDAITNTKGATSPIVATRSAAIVQSAVFDAVNGIERRYNPIHVQPGAAPGASQRAAAVQAAYWSLAKLFPAQQSALEIMRNNSISAIASEPASQNSQSILRGIEWGQMVADQILAWRSGDGFLTAPPPFVGGTAPGQWRPTPPAFAPGAVPQFAHMTPWAIQSPSQFLPPGPPALTSAQYAADFNEVKQLGSVNSAARTSDQTAAAQFWQSASSPDYFWDRVAVSLASERHFTLSENSRLLALVNIAIADGGIAAWNGKYMYVFWRPITAIQLADTDGNPATVEDPLWTPLLVTPAYPEYSSGLLFVSSAAIGVLARYFGEHTAFTVDSNGVPGVRFFPDFTAALDELVAARIWGGIHFRTADVDSRIKGTALANYVLDNSLQPVNGLHKGQVPN